MNKNFPGFLLFLKKSCASKIVDNFKSLRLKHFTVRSTTSNRWNHFFHQFRIDCQSPENYHQCRLSTLQTPNHSYFKISYDSLKLEIIIFSERKIRGRKEVENEVGIFWQNFVFWAEFCFFQRFWKYSADFTNMFAVSKRFALTWS